MRKKLSFILLLSLALFIGCNNNKEITTNSKLEPNNKVSTPSTTPPTPKLIITDNTISYSPYLPVGNVIFFPDKENNNRLSTIRDPDSSGYIKQSDINDIFEYPVESLATINNIIYFSNGSDGNTLYSLDYQRNQSKKLNNNYIFNLTANVNTLFYINKNDKDKLYSFNVVDSTSSILTNDSLGKFIINGDYILYQNLSDGANLYSVKLDGSNRMKLTDVSVDSFVTYKNEILFINSDDNNTLYRLNPTTLKITRLNIVQGENLKSHDSNLFIVDTSNSNNLSSLTIDFDNNTASTSKLTNDTINDYFPTSKGIFIEKSPNINKSYILK